MLSNKADSIESNLIEMAYGSVRSKVAQALLKFKSTSQSESQDEIVITASREDLAAIAGTAKETTIRTLSDFKSEGIISIGAKSIVIKNPEKLLNLAR